jgi:hypothetical protein
MANKILELTIYEKDYLHFDRIPRQTPDPLGASDFPDSSTHSSKLTLDRPRALTRPRRDKSQQRYRNYSERTARGSSDDIQNAKPFVIRPSCRSVCPCSLVVCASLSLSLSLSLQRLSVPSERRLIHTSPHCRCTYVAMGTPPPWPGYPCCGYTTPPWPGYAMGCATAIATGWHPTGWATATGCIGCA